MRLITQHPEDGNLTIKSTDIIDVRPDYANRYTDVFAYGKWIRTTVSYGIAKKLLFQPESNEMQKYNDYEDFVISL